MSYTAFVRFVYYNSCCLIRLKSNLFCAANTRPLMYQVTRLKFAQFSNNYKLENFKILC